MKKKSNFQSAFLNLRLLIPILLFSGGVFLTLLARESAQNGESPGGPASNPHLLPPDVSKIFAGSRRLGIPEHRPNRSRFAAPGGVPCPVTLAYISNQGDNSVSVIDTASNAVVATVSVGNVPFGVAVALDGSRVYVANLNDNNVSVIDASNNTVVATVPVGNSPEGVAVAPDGTHVYVVNDNSASVSVIDTSTNTVVATVPVGSGPVGVAVAPDGARVYVTNSDTTISVIDTSNNTVVATVPVSGSHDGVAVTPDGTRVYVANDNTGSVSVIDTSTNTVVATVPVGNSPYTVAIAPDGSRAYAANLGDNNVSVIDTSSNAVVATVPVGGFPLGVAVTPDGTRVYVANIGDNSVSVIDTSNNTVVATVLVGSSPGAFGNFIGVIVPCPSPTPTASPSPTATVTPSATPTPTVTPSPTTTPCAEEWVVHYNASANGQDQAVAIATDNSGNVYVTGASEGLGYDYATIKYDASGNQLWEVRYNNEPVNGNDLAAAIAVDASGNVYVTGRSQGSDTGLDYATIKYDAFGNELWVRRYDGGVNADDLATAVAVDVSSNVYVTGWSRGSGTGYDYATVKYDASGNELWVRRYDGGLNGNGDNQAYAMAVDSAGNVCVTGASIGSGTGYDYATIKYDASGNELWVRRYTGTEGIGNDFAYAIAIDSADNVYVTGKSWGGPSFNDNYATIKYDSSGTQQWVARYNAMNYADAAYAIAVDSEHNAYVTGTSHGRGALHDYATIKYDVDGQQQWVARYHGPGNADDVSNAIAVDSSGSVYVTGFSAGSNTGFHGYDYATIKYDSSGQEAWVARYNGPGNDDDEAKAIALDNSGNVYVTGWSWSFGGDTMYDYATIKYSHLPNCPTPTPTPTPTPPPPRGCDSGIIVNGGFESGNFTGWTIDGNLNPPVVTMENPHTGSFSALAGSTSPVGADGESSFFQQFTVPPNGATLTFSHWDFTMGDGDIRFHWQDAYITDSAGNILLTILHQCLNTQEWTTEEVDLSPFAGQTVRIKFLVNQDDFFTSNPTAMYVDDVALMVPCASPTPPPTATPTPSSTVTPTPSATPTPTPTATATPTMTPTATPTASPTVPPRPTPTPRPRPIPRARPTPPTP
jgi:YVTN family beta-propeller protein